MIDPELTNRFFLESDSEELRRIYLWARARYAAPWAVFGAVLLRVVASTGPGVQLPGVIGGPASLNMIAAFVSPSGGGKGISDRVAREVWPTPIIERPIGSGEGIAALFAPPKKEDVEPITRAIINVTEIDTLAGIAARQGNILLAQLKAAVMGELIGQSNASEATTRIVPAHTYRMAMSVGAQPGHTSVIFNDTTGGTPQRILWFPTIDPDMPAEAIPDPEPLNTRLPGWVHGDTVVIYGPPEIAEQIVSAHLARQRGDADALDGHRMLTRCKVGVALAVLHHRSVVSESDWHLSDIVMTVSDRTREWVLAEAKRAERAKIRDRAISRAVGEEFIDQRRYEVVQRRVRKILAEGPATYGDINRRVGKREYRELLGSAIDGLLRCGDIYSEKLDRGTRYTLTPEFNVEPEFNHGNPSSQMLNRQFNVELVSHPAELDTPSSDGLSRGERLTGTPTPEDAMKPPRPTRCEVCYIALPTSANRPVCEDCADAPAPRPATNRQTERPMHVVHSGASSDRGRLSCDRHAPNGYSPQQTPKESA